MKWIFILLCLFKVFDVHSNDTTIISALIKEDCPLKEFPRSLASRTLLNLYKNEPILILNLTPENEGFYGKYWYYILTMDGISGFINKNDVDLPESIFSSLLKEGRATERMSKTRNFYDQHLDSLRKTTQHVLNKRKQEKEDKINEAIQTAKTLRAEFGKYKIAVDYSTSLNILNYPDFDIQILNTSKSKTIKYIWFTVHCINPVKDVIGTKVLKGVGPISPYEKGIYNFSSILVSKVVDYCKVRAIKIQYMDGTIVNATEKEIKKSSLVTSYDFNQTNE